MKHPFTWLMIAGLVVVGLLLSMRQSERPAARGAVRLYCAASNRAVVEAVRRQYELECQRRVEVEFGASQTLLSAIEISGQGDLYLPADDSYLAIAKERGVVGEVLPLATMRLVACVPRGNPAGVRSLEDLLRADVRLVQADPDAAAIGKLTRDLLKPQGKWDELRASTMAFRSTVTEVANDVKLGAADVGIVFDAVLSTYPDLEAVEIPELKDGVARIAVGIVCRSAKQEQARHFARYLSAIDRGQKEYDRFGFTPLGDERWADPE